MSEPCCFMRHYQVSQNTSPNYMSIELPATLTSLAPAAFHCIGFSVRQNIHFHLDVHGAPFPVGKPTPPGGVCWSSAPPGAAGRAGAGEGHCSARGVTGKCSHTERGLLLLQKSCMEPTAPQMVWIFRHLPVNWDVCSHITFPQSEGGISPPKDRISLKISPWRLTYHGG